MIFFAKLFVKGHCIFSTVSW